MPNVYPDEFYTSKSRVVKTYSRTHKPHIDIQRFLKGRADYFYENKVQKTKAPKKLIIADWRIKNASSMQLAEMDAAIKRLIEDGFEVYSPTAEGLMRVSKVSSCYIPISTCLNHSQLKQSCARQGFSQDEIFILDEYWFHAVVHNQYDGPRLLYLSDFDAIQEDSWEDVLSYMQQATPPLTGVVYDVFNPRKTLKAWIRLEELKKLKESERDPLSFTVAYRQVVLDGPYTNILMQHGQVTSYLQTLSWSDLSSDVKVLVLSDLEGIDRNQMVALLEKMPALVSIELFGDATQEGVLEAVFHRAPCLQDLRMCVREMRHGLELEQVLYTLPYLETLHLPDLDDDFDLKPNCLPYLKKIRGLRRNPMQTAIACVKAAPNLIDSDLAEIDLTADTTFPANEAVPIDLFERLVNSGRVLSIELVHVCLEAGDLSIKSGALAALKSLEVDSAGITMTQLQMIVSAAPHLESLTLMMMPPISTQALIALLDAAPHLSTLDLTGTPIEDDPDLKARLSQIQTVQMDSVMEPAPSRPVAAPPLPTEPKHDPSDYYDLNPDAVSDAPSHSKNQIMVSQKFAAYLKLNSQNPDILIQRIQRGICAALAYYFVQEQSDATHQLLDDASAWDGRAESLTAHLSTQFEKLYEYIYSYQLHQHRKVFFLGDDLGDFLLRQPEGALCVLHNPWHAIGVQRTSSGWIFYDSNMLHGPREVSDAAIVDTIHDYIGHLVCTDSTVSITPDIKNPDAFLAQGGLLLLNYVEQKDALLSAFKTSDSFSQSALDGLMMRDTSKRPAWVYGLTASDNALVLLTTNLLNQFVAQNPEAHAQRLHQSIALMTDIGKIDAIACLSQIGIDITPAAPRQVSKSEEHRDHGPAAAEPATVLADASEDVYIDRAYYTKRFSTWESERRKTHDVGQYNQYIVDRTQGKSLLLEFSEGASVDALRVLLIEHCRHTGRPVFYVDTPDDLVTSSDYIKRVGSRGEQMEGPGGPLYDFIQANQDNAPIIIVNYDNFDADEIVQFNALLDDAPKADGTDLSPHTKVIGLMNTHRPGCYRGADFSSRFSKKEPCAVPMKILQEKMRAVPIRASDRDAIADHAASYTVIDLYDSPDWEQVLLGSWIPRYDEGQTVFEFKPGRLDAAIRLGKPIVIQNGPWDLPAFQRFWDLACTTGYRYEGEEIKIPAHIDLIRTSGYALPDAASIAYHEDALAPEGYAILNPSTLYQFLPGYVVDDTGALVYDEGLIAAAAGNTLSIQMTRDVTPAEATQLFDVAEKHGTRLAIYPAPKVALRQWQDKPGARNPVSAIQVIESTDPDTTIATLRLQGEDDWQVIDVSECDASDLLPSIQATPAGKGLVMRQEKGALVQARENNQNIILTGTPSDALCDELMGFMMAHTQYRGRLRVVLSDTHAFNGLPNGFTHAPGFETKARCLGLSRDEATALEAYQDEPLSMLAARAHYLSTHSGKDSHDAWQGMYELPGGLQALSHAIDLSRTKANAAAFNAARLKQVTDVLDASPYVFLSGLTGVGKTTFVEKVLCGADTAHDLFQGEDAIRSWIDAPKGDGMHILLIDEANLSTRQWSEFEGLYNTPPTILMDGVLHVLGPQHKVVFAGNPVSYGDERAIAPFFKRHGQSVVFEPLSVDMIYEAILKPIFSSSGLSEGLIQRIVLPILEVYAEFCKHSKDKVLISPRELEMMAMLAVNQLKDNPEAIKQVQAITYRAIWTVLQGLQVDTALSDFLQKHQTASEALLASQTETLPVLSSGFLVTPSRQAARQQLEDVLAVAADRRGGLGGIVFEGDPGVGKSEFIFSILKEQKQKFYHMPVSLSVPEKEALLLKAFDEGALVVVDEINSAPMMERLLNSLLMGKKPNGDLPKNPGFFVVGTRNPIHMAGRRAASTALDRRLLHATIPPYSKAEMIMILSHKGVPAFESAQIVDVYETQLMFAKTRNLAPAPTFRDLSKAVDEVYFGKSRHQVLSAEAEAPEDTSEATMELKKALQMLRQAPPDGPADDAAPGFN